VTRLSGLFGLAVPGPRWRARQSSGQLVLGIGERREPSPLTATQINVAVDYSDPALLDALRTPAMSTTTVVRRAQARLHRHGKRMSALLLNRTEPPHDRSHSLSQLRSTSRMIRPFHIRRNVAEAPQGIFD
jgi:hypothetical protein